MQHASRERGSRPGIGYLVARADEVKIMHRVAVNAHRTLTTAGFRARKTGDARDPVRWMRNGFLKGLQ